MIKSVCQRKGESGKTMKGDQRKNINPLHMKPREFRELVRQEKWADITMEACQGYAQANMVILPKEYAYDFLLFCTRNPKPCLVLEVNDSGETSWVQVTNATLNFGIIYQKKGVAYDPLLSIKY